MQLARLEGPPAPAAVAATAPASDPADGTVAVATADGLLRLLPLAGTASCAYAVHTRCAHGSQPRILCQPFAALCCLPGGGGLLLAQLGSGRLLFSPPPGALGDRGDLFLLGAHEVPITAIQASCCGSFALSGDAQGGLKMWSLDDGALLATGAAAVPGAAVAAACFLADGAAATLQQHSSLVQVWSTAGSRLTLQGELDAAGSGGGSGGSSPRTITALSACGPLLALGCSDGSTQVWRRSGSEFEQHVRIGAPSSEAPVHCLAISGSSNPAAALLAVAAGPAVTISSLAAGEPLAQRMLQEVPAALYWSKAGELHALLPDGCRLQRLGAPQPAAGAAPPQAAGTAAAAASPRKKAVRFADHQTAEAADSSGPQTAGAPVQAPSPWQPGPPARSAPPPLPSHPLLRSSHAGSSFDPPATASTSVPLISCAHESGGRCRTMPGASAVAGRCPLYPILDLRALQGLRPAATGSAGSAVCGAASSGGARQPQAAVLQQPAPFCSMLPTQQHTAAARAVAPAAGISMTRSQRHAGTSTEPVGPASSSLERPAQEASPCKAAAAAAPAPEDADGQAPQPRSLPLPLQRHRSPAALDVPSVSKQQCDACKLLVAAADDAAAPAVSRPGSPAKAALLAQVAALGRTEATAHDALAAAERGSSSLSGSRPVSPLKLGVVCTRQNQQAAELLPAEARPFTVVELDASLAHSEFRQLRYARISRRCGGRQQVAATESPAAKQQAALPQVPLAVDPAADAEAAVSAEAGEAPASAQAAMLTNAGADAGAGQAPAQPGATRPKVEAIDTASAPAAGRAAAAAPPAQAAGEQEGACGAASTSLCLGATAPAGAQLHPGGFAVASDTELTDEEPEEEPAAEPSRSAGGAAAVAHHVHRHLPVPVDGGWGGNASSASSARGSRASLAQVRITLQKLDSKLGSLAATAEVQQAPPPPASPRPPIQQMHGAESAAAQAATLLAVPAPQSSLLPAHRRQALEEQAAGGAAVPLPEELQAEVRCKAATAAATVPPGARLYSSLPPPASPASGGRQLSTRKAAALAGATKQLDSGWVAEQQELKPVLEDMWVARPPQPSGLLALPGPLVVPLPQPRQLAFDFLGLRT